MNNWPKYQSHKIVQAAKIVGVERNGGEIIIWARPAGQEFDGGQIERFIPTVPGMAEKAEVGDWAMLYPDGFRSISPEKAFEGYTRIQEPTQ